MIYITNIEERNESFEIILNDWVNKNRKIQFLETFNDSAADMQENSLTNELYEYFYTKCSANDSETKSDYAFNKINNLSILQSLQVLLQIYKVPSITLLVVEDNFISDYQTLKICA